MTKKLDNYLRTHRRRAGLTQDEIALLLGAKCGTKVSRYECGRRAPTLATALAYEAIFGTPVRVLFAGLYEKVERDATGRMATLVQQLERSNGDRATAQKLAALCSAREGRRAA